MYLNIYGSYVNLDSYLLTDLFKRIKTQSLPVLIFFFLFSTNFINAQVAVSATAEAIAQSVATLTVPITVPAGADRLLLVSVGGDGTTSSVKFGTTDMVQEGSTSTYILTLGTGASTTETIEVTTAPAGLILAINAISFTGVDQTTPLENHVETTVLASAGATNLTVSSKVNDLVFDGVILGCVGLSCSLTLTENVGQTIQNSISLTPFGAAALGKTSTKPGATSVDLDWTFSGATADVNHTAVNVRSSIPLPVELTYFTAHQSKEEVLLSWKTLSETNNEGFEIERSIDGTIFEKIGSINGQGSTNNSKRYNFTDDSPSQKTLYYRLKQIDFDGGFEYSNVEVVHFTKDDLSIYPNPVFDIVFIKTPFHRTGTVQIYDGLGKLLKQFTISGDDNSLDLSDLPTGILLLKIQSNNQVFFEKITKL